MVVPTISTPPKYSAVTRKWSRKCLIAPGAESPRAHPGRFHLHIASNLETSTLLASSHVQYSTRPQLHILDSEMFNPTSIVLVTGANGHVASHIVDQLLALTDGPVVRGTVRSQKSVNLLASHYKGRVSEGRFEIICVPDMLADGAFDEAVKGALLSDVYHQTHLWL
jgi:hypothetical protein